MKYKYLKKHGVLTAGAGQGRMVLDYDAKVIYAYHDPSYVKSIYEAGKWHLTKQSDYSRGAYGSYSTGNFDGYSRHTNAKALINLIGGGGVRYNVPSFPDKKEWDTYLTTNAKFIKLQASAKALNQSIDLNFELQDLKPKTLYSRFGHGKSYGRGVNPVTYMNKLQKGIDLFIKGAGQNILLANYAFNKNVIMIGNKRVCFRDKKGQIFMNSELLQGADLELKLNDGQSEVQKQIRKIAKYHIPFNVLADANLKLAETTILEQGPESTHTIKSGYGKTERRHFTGALLLENKGRKFLMDIDRIEIEHQLFNAFFVEVSSECKSILNAYESMKPESVKLAESQGLKVKRQGEWFFIPTGKTLEMIGSSIHTWKPEDEEALKPHLERFDISHGKGRPNQLYKPVNFGAEFDDLVCGVVSHTGREHTDLCLGIIQLTEGNGVEETILSKPKTLTGMPGNYGANARHFLFQLFKVIGNTTIGNFTITGDID